jgi:ParB family transcriptional regulator, chromosome partitioning protein
MKEELRLDTQANQVKNKQDRVFPTPTTFQWIPLTAINPDSTLAKSSIILKDIELYADKIIQKGFDTAIMVRELNSQQYEIILGSKLYFAANIANMERIPAIVLNNQSDENQKEEIRTLFNWSDLDEIETAKAYQFFLERFNYTHDELANLLEVSRPLITNQLRILQLPLEIRQQLQQNILTKSQCHLLLRLPTELEQLELSKRIVRENLSVRKISTIIRKQSQKNAKENLRSNKTKNVKADVERLLKSISTESADEVLSLVNHLLKKSSS